MAATICVSVLKGSHRTIQSLFCVLYLKIEALFIVTRELDDLGPSPILTRLGEITLTELQRESRFENDCLVL